VTVLPNATRWTDPAPRCRHTDTRCERHHRRLLRRSRREARWSAFLGQPPAAEDIAALFHTGGTTGKPKPAAHTHANEVTDAWMIAANSLLDEHWVLFAALPLFHVNALVVTLLSPLLRGQQVVWAGPLGYRDPAFCTSPGVATPSPTPRYSSGG
jgi:acyl-CoA synthetase (AMP-forming)/AMP-acid ligase II